MIRIILDWKHGLDSDGLMPRNESDWVGLILAVFHQTEYKPFFGFGRNDSEWFGNRFRNSSDSFGMNFNPIFSPGLLLNCQYPVKKLPNFIPICDEGLMRLAISGYIAANFAVQMRTIEDFFFFWLGGVSCKQLFFCEFFRERWENLSNR